MSEQTRYFETGATRDAEGTKPDYEGFFCPLTIAAYGEYMTKHRMQTDGKLRDSDNWQKGIPLPAYMKSLFRHFVQLWTLHRGYPAYDDKTGELLTVEDVCCAILFNTFGYMHETLKRRREAIHKATKATWPDNKMQ